jgi:PleD family two-component response regulator
MKLGRSLLGHKDGEARTPQAADASYVLDEVKQMAEQGRRLAIYDRATGLYAYWYLQLRGDEEASRAERYGKPLSCISLWAADAEAVPEVANILKTSLRDHDLAGYLNNGHFVLLLLETGPEGASVVLARLRRLLGDRATAHAASFPDGGTTFDALLESAKSGSGAVKAA